MRITHWGEYGIHFAVYLAQKHRDGQTIIGASEIAAQQGMAIDYAQQVLQRMRKGGVIESVRGPQGGYQLSRTPSEITLLDVLMAVEGHTFEIMCNDKPLNGDRCDPGTPCYLRGLWHDLRDHVDSFLTNYSLEDMIKRAEKIEEPVQIGSNTPSA